MRKSTVFLLGAMVGFALLAPAQEAAAQGRGNGGGSAVAYDVTNPYSATLRACGEVVQLDGWVKIKLVDQESASGNKNFAWHINGKAEGVSRTSGAQYRWNMNSLVRTNGDPTSDGHYSEHTMRRVRAIGQGDATDYMFDFHVLLNWNANGDLTANFHESNVSCRP
jgi:hypothetical protein